MRQLLIFDFIRKIFVSKLFNATERTIILPVLVAMLFLHSGLHAQQSDKFEENLKAAQNGNALAQYHTGINYEKGIGVPQNYAEAFKWYQKAAEQGNAIAQNALGDLYYYGKGVSQSGNEAFKWYTKAADQGNADAQYNLGAIYYEGWGLG